MTLVVADTGPVRYLAVIESIHLLPRLFDQVIIPKAVLAELTHPRAPEAARRWANDLPTWAVIREAAQIELADVLDPGEAEAIALAGELKADLVLIDEREARREAARRRIPVIGTIGILEEAAARNLIDLPEALQRLLATNFRIDRRYLDDALHRDAERRERLTRRRDPQP
jgi:predicted nucleic acid-binding protein